MELHPYQTQTRILQQYIVSTGRRQSEVSEKVQRLNRLESVLLERRLRTLDHKEALAREQIAKLIRKTRVKQFEFSRHGETSFDLRDYELWKENARTTSYGGGSGGASSARCAVSFSMMTGKTGAENQRRRMSGSQTARVVNGSGRGGQPRVQFVQQNSVDDLSGDRRRQLRQQRLQSVQSARDKDSALLTEDAECYEFCEKLPPLTVNSNVITAM